VVGTEGPEGVDDLVLEEREAPASGNLPADDPRDRRITQWRGEFVEPVLRPRDGILGQEGNDPSARHSRPEVAGTAMAEIAVRDLVQQDRRVGRHDFEGAVGRSRIDDKDFNLAVEILRANRREHLAQVPVAVESRDDDRHCDRVHGAARFTIAWAARSR